jgi:hypothetical protein
MIPAIGTKTADIQGTEFYWFPTKYLQPDHPVNAARSANGVLFMKLGFICPNLPAHLNPMTALERQRRD